MNAIIAINAYQKVGTESKVVGADPHQLISMLFHGAILAVNNAKGEIVRKDIDAKGKSINKAVAIIGEGLHASLDMRVGGELAQNLSSLYDYMVKRLIEANIKNDITILDEVERLLTEITGAWDSIRPKSAQPMPIPDASSHARLAYGRA
jgi:flagellar protein FliS